MMTRGRWLFWSVATTGAALHLIVRYVDLHAILCAIAALLYAVAVLCFLVAVSLAYALVVPIGPND